MSHEDIEFGQNRLELISFQLGDQEYCLDIMAVREIRGWSVTTPLPQAPSYVRGVVNLRGTVLPIIDLASRLGFGMTDPSARHAIIVAQIGKSMVGLLVDAVSEILTTTLDAVQPAPDVGCESVARFVKGILTIEGRMISWIALDHILPSDALAEAA